MVGENLQPGPNDEQHEHQVEEVQDPQPARESGVHWGLERTRSGVCLDEGLHHWIVSKMLCYSNSDNEHGSA